MRKLMFFLIGLLAVFNLISAYASYNNEKYEALEDSGRSEIVQELGNSQT
ncbi:hypothetical protein HNR50_000303 [Spirochaeta isovalerica]|uniref:Uncharacterized protein n=1 Tax=Spirochaeta isovalerica TaxID=150 RepID=A0A841R6K3_9SPIO|nr:hypothetical protein [Spirochaeta isovalerica]